MTENKKLISNTWLKTFCSQLLINMLKMLSVGTYFPSAGLSRFSLGVSVLQSTDRMFGFADVGQDHTLMSYRAPHLAVSCLSEHFTGNPEKALVLDVACGTGCVAKLVRAVSFQHYEPWSKVTPPPPH